MWRVCLSRSLSRAFPSPSPNTNIPRKDQHGWGLYQTWLYVALYGYSCYPWISPLWSTFSLIHYWPFIANEADLKGRKSCWRHQNRGRVPAAKSSLSSLLIWAPLPKSCTQKLNPTNNRWSYIFVISGIFVMLLRGTALLCDIVTHPVWITSFVSPSLIF